MDDENFSKSVGYAAECLINYWKNDMYKVFFRN